MGISAETHTIRQCSDAHSGSLGPRKQRVTRPAAPTGDEELVVQAQQGDATAYGLLYERYHRYTRKVLSDDVHDVEARNDILQSVFERGWSKIGMLRYPKVFKAWIAQLARRLAIDHYRSSSRTVATDPTDPDEEFDLASDDWSAHDWAAMNELAGASQIGIHLIDPIERDGALITAGSIVDAATAQIWCVVTPDSPPEDPTRAMALVFGASFPAATELVSDFAASLT